MINITLYVAINKVKFYPQLHDISNVRALQRNVEVDCTKKIIHEWTKWFWHLRIWNVDLELFMIGSIHSCGQLGWGWKFRVGWLTFSLLGPNKSEQEKWSDTCWSLQPAFQLERTCYEDRWIPKIIWLKDEIYIY